MNSSDLDHLGSGKTQIPYVSFTKTEQLDTVNLDARRFACIGWESFLDRSVTETD